MHVGDTVAAAGLQGHRALACTADSKADMAGGVAVAVAGRSGGAGLADAPARAEPVPDEPRADERVLLGRRAVAAEELLPEIAQRVPALRRVDDRTAKAVGRSSGHSEKRGRDETARRRFG